MKTCLALHTGTDDFSPHSGDFLRAVQSAFGSATELTHLNEPLGVPASAALCSGLNRCRNQIQEGITQK